MLCYLFLSVHSLFFLPSLPWMHKTICWRYWKAITECKYYPTQGRKEERSCQFDFPGSKSNRRKKGLVFPFSALFRHCVLFSGNCEAHLIIISFCACACKNWKKKGMRTLRANEKGHLTDTGSQRLWQAGNDRGREGKTIHGKELRPLCRLAVASLRRLAAAWATDGRVKNGAIF